MTKMHRLARVLHPRSERSFAVFKKITRARIKVGLVAAALFALAYAVETKALLALESSQGPFEVTADHDRNTYR